eukprot:sb/3471373/
MLFPVIGGFCRKVRASGSCHTSLDESEKSSKFLKGLTYATCPHKEELKTRALGICSASQLKGKLEIFGNFFSLDQLWNWYWLWLTCHFGHSIPLLIVDGIERIWIVSIGNDPVGAPVDPFLRKAARCNAIPDKNYVTINFHHLARVLIPGSIIIYKDDRIIGCQVEEFYRGSVHGKVFLDECFVW